MIRFRLPALSLILIGLLCSGCIYSREIQHTRKEIARANPDIHIDQQISANLGPFSLRLAGWITSLVDDEDALRASRYLRDIRRVKVGVFDVRGGDGGLNGVTEMRRFQRRGWELAAKVRDDDESVWLYYRERDGSVRDLYAIVYSEDELVIARLSGRLTHLMEAAMRDYAESGGLDLLSDWE